MTEQKKVVLSDKDVEKMNETLISIRTGTGIGRFASYKRNEKTGNLVQTFRTTQEVCTGDIQSRGKIWCESDVFLLSYNGACPANKGSGGIEGGLYGEHHFSGDKVSLTWLKFMLDPVFSPWKMLFPFIHNINDVERINSDTGFIFTDVPKIPASALFTFCMAARFAQENNNRAILFKLLVDEGINPKIAYLTCHSFGVRTEYGEKSSVNSPTRSVSPPGHHFQMCGTGYIARAFYYERMKEDVAVGVTGCLRGNWGADNWWDYQHYTNTDVSKRFGRFTNKGTLIECAKHIQDYCEGKVDLL